MQKWFVGLILCAVGSPSAAAEVRLNPTSMSCAEVQSAIARHGAVILTRPSKNVPGLPIYGRYVANTSYCKWMQLSSGRVPTSDNPACPVKTCTPNPTKGNRGSPR